MPLSSFLVESTLPPCRGQRREGFSSPLSMLLDRGGFTSQRACAGEFDGAGPKEDLANGRGEREREAGSGAEPCELLRDPCYFLWAPLGP